MKSKKIINTNLRGAVTLLWYRGQWKGVSKVCFFVFVF